MEEGEGDPNKFQQPNSIFSIMEKCTTQKELSLKQKQTKKVNKKKKAEDNLSKLRKAIAGDFGTPCSTVSMNLKEKEKCKQQYFSAG